MEKGETPPPPNSEGASHPRTHIVLYLVYSILGKLARGNFMDEKIIQAIEAILRRGNDAEVRKKGDGVIVLEVKKTIKHST